MDRRAFLHRLGFGTVATAAAAIGAWDVERFLWTPRKTILLPPASGWAVNAADGLLRVGDVITLSDRYLEPAARAMATAIDTHCLQHFVITGLTSPTTLMVRRF